MREPLDDQTTTTDAPDGADAAEGSSPPVAQTGPDGFTVRVDGVEAGGPLPATLTCEDGNQAPSLVWQNVPADAQELAISVTDPDAEGFVHWLVVGIDPSLAGLDGTDLPPGAQARLNGAGEASWFGPCPPPGPAHDYVFTLYALGEQTSFDPIADTSEVISQLAGSSLGVTSTAGTFAATEATTTTTAAG
jgi:hypothetical protein